MEGLFPVFEYHAGNRQFCRMANGECSLRSSDSGGHLGGAAVKKQRGPAALRPDNLDLQPVHTPADPRSQCLGPGFLGGKARRQAFGRIALPKTIGLLGLGENTVKKAPSISIHGFLDSPDLNHIDAASHDHDAYEAISWGRLVHWPRPGGDVQKPVSESSHSATHIKVRAARPIQML